jgi:ribosomal protein S6--L-glutamate ligase
MKIGILSFKPSGRRAAEEELRIKAAAERLGHKAQIFRSERCQLVYDGKSERVLYMGKRFPKIDVLIPRASILNNVDIRLSVVKQFQQMGVPVVNDYMSIARAKNKVRTQQILHSLGLPTPHTVVIHDKSVLNAAIDAVGGAPVILKDPFGSYGSGVVIAESKRAARSVLDAMATPILMVQEYISESGGKDTRVFVVGSKVIAAMERSAQAEEFRSNVELGGETRPVEVSDRYAQIAIASTKALGLEVSGVDIIETKKGPAVLEVNGNPGFKALEAATGVNVAEAIVLHAIAKVAGEV